MASPELEHLFYEGSYERILTSTANTRSGLLDPFVVGALAFTGRLDEAEITGRLVIADDSRPEAEAVAVRFFLCAGACHAGMHEKAMRWARQNLAAIRAVDARSRFFAYQGFGLVRYFEGRMDRSRRFARRALSAAIEAGLPYGRLLALDLRGHALTQTGQVSSGLRLLEQAEHLALDLGFVANAKTIEVAEHIYRVRCRVQATGDSLSRLRELAHSPIVSFFARRNAFLELAWQQAFQGEIQAAEDSLNEAARIALPDSDRRGRARACLARTIVLLLSQGRIASTPYLEEARRLAELDASLRAEVLFVEAAILRTTRATLAPELDELASATGIERATIARSLVGPTPASSRLPSEDRLGELLCSLRSMAPRARATHLVNEQLLGLVPWSLGLDPGRRVYLTEQAVLTEDHGTVSVHRYPSGPSMRILRELTDGPKTNAELLGSVWNLRTYSPSRHDPTLHTAVARLRAALAPRAEWVVTTQHGYQLAPDVELVVVGDELEIHTPDRIEAAAVGMTAVSNRESHILEIIGRRHVASSAELAQDLRVSDATALRSLRVLVGDGKIHRTGRGKSTRYSLFPEALPAEGERS
ncbi:MAG: hypothetical protein JRF42_12330 [Deltaproteobacteria bacterium]|nr:hypothetical protein [Deltaproteobacteria bacterium]